MAQAYGTVSKGGSLSQTLKDAGFDRSVYTSKSAWDKVAAANKLDSKYTVYQNQKLDFSVLLNNTPAQQPAATDSTTTINTPTTPSQVDTTLQEYQKTYKEKMDALSDSQMSADDVEAQVNEMMQELVIPEPPKLTDLYTQLSESTGLNNITERLTALKNERAMVEDRLRSRMSYIEGQQVSMDVIGGQTSEVQRQEQQNLQYINSAIQVTVEEQQGALSYIQTYVTLTGQDYQNALNHYTTVFDTKMKAIQMINDAKQVEWSQEMEIIKWEQGVASAQLSMYADMIAAGTMFLGNLSDEQKIEIGRLEVQAGLPLGFLAKVQIDPSKRIQSISQRQGSDGYMYSDVVKIDPQTGALTVDSIKLGKFYVAPRSAPAPKDTSVQQAIATFTSILESAKGSDQKVSPQTYQANKTKWVQAGGNSAEFDANFGRYINTKYAYREQNAYGLDQATWLAGQKTQ